MKKSVIITFGILFLFLSIVTAGMSFIQQSNSEVNDFISLINKDSYSISGIISYSSDNKTLYKDLNEILKETKSNACITKLVYKGELCEITNYLEVHGRPIENRVSPLNSKYKFKIKDLKTRVIDKSIKGEILSVANSNKEELKNFEIFLAEKHIGFQQCSTTPASIDFRIPNLIITILVFVLIFLILFFSFLRSYKRIGIEKLLGISDLKILRRRISVLFLIMILCDIITVTLMFMFLPIKSNTILGFHNKIWIMFAINFVGGGIALLLPLIIVKKIRVQNMLKNQRPKNIITSANVFSKCVQSLYF